jgi:hypothetical protein
VKSSKPSQSACTPPNPQALEAQLAAAKLAAEDAASKLESEACALRSKVSQLEGLVRGKERELARAATAAETAAAQAASLQAQVGIICAERIDCVRVGIRWCPARGVTCALHTGAGSQE